MPNMPSIADPVLTKEQRQRVREEAYRLLERGHALPNVHAFLAVLFSTNTAVIRAAMGNMKKPTERPNSEQGRNIRRNQPALNQG
jgi:ADP-dependent phosphofructokinase/glucokinase